MRALCLGGGEDAHVRSCVCVRACVCLCKRALACVCPRARVWCLCGGEDALPVLAEGGEALAAVVHRRVLHVVAHLPKGQVNIYIIL